MISISRKFNEYFLNIIQMQQRLRYKLLSIEKLTFRTRQGGFRQQRRCTNAISPIVQALYLDIVGRRGVWQRGREIAT
jgi:hypothetical protein